MSNAFFGFETSRDKFESATSDVGVKPHAPEQLFENLPELIKPEAVAAILGISIATIYDWRYRSKQRGVPEGLFLKFNRFLYLRTEVLKRWILSQNPSLT